MDRTRTHTLSQPSSPIHLSLAHLTPQHPQSYHPHRFSFRACHLIWSIYKTESLFFFFCRFYPQEQVHSYSGEDQRGQVRVTHNGINDRLLK